MGREYIRKVEALHFLTPDPNVLLLDTFQSLNHWAFEGTGNDWTAVRDASVYQITRSDPDLNCSLKMTTRTTSPAILDYVQATRRAPSSPAKRFSLQVDHYPPILTNDMLEPHIHLAVIRGGVRHDAGIRYNFFVDSWQYLSAIDTWTTCDPIGPHVNDYQWRTLSLAVDVGAGTYLHMDAMSWRHDLSHVDLVQSAAAGDYLEIILRGRCKQVGPDPIHYAQAVLRETT